MRLRPAAFIYDLPLIMLFAAGLYLFAEEGRELVTIETQALHSVEASLLRSRHEHLLYALQQSTNHLQGIAQSPALQRTIEQDDGAPLVALEQGFVTLLFNNPFYSQVRWIDRHGRERVRADRKDQLVSVTPRELLQDKSDCYYYRNAMRLSEGEFCFSPMDLNVEQGAIVSPYQPTLRIGYRLGLSLKGEDRGFLMLNINIEHLLERYLKEHGFWLINQYGDWLIAPQEVEPWGFMFDQPTLIDDEFPGMLSEIRKHPFLQQRDGEGGLLSSIQVSPAEGLGVAGRAAEHWYLLKYLPQEEYQLLLDTKAAQRQQLLASMVILAGVTYLLLLLMRFRRNTLERRLRAAEREQIRLLEERERSLASVVKAKDDFLSSMSHELRTPLTTMIGYNEIMSEEDALPAQYREMVQSSLLAGRTLLQLVNDILDMSKIRSGKFVLSEGPFDLRRALSDLRELMQVYAQEKRITIHLTIADEMEALLDYNWIGDEMRLSQLLFNLLSNAVKFSDPGGSIELRIRTSHPQQWDVPGLRPLTLEVEDHGIGMSQEVQSRLFAPFEQADASTSKRFGGTGLGLYICKQLVELMGGEIVLQSREGVGSTFRVTLSLRHSEERVVRTTVVAVTEVPQLTGRVLLAEDTLQLQRLTTMLIVKCGVTVEVANNGVEALEMGRSGDYALILMDMQMPEMDGIEATRLLREAGVTTPIVALSANVLQQHRELFEQAGGSGYLNKPIRRSALYRILATHLSPATAAAEIAGAARGEMESALEEEEDLSDLLDEEMMEEFWDYMAQAKGELQQAWEQHDWGQLRKTAHAIKGMGASYGQPEMTRYGALLQEHAVGQNRESCAQWVEQLIRLCSRAG